MPRIIFLQDFDYKPISQQTFSYRKGEICLVTTEIADLALKTNKAKLYDFEGPANGINETIKKFPRKSRKKPVVGERSPFLKGHSATVS